MTSLFTPPSDLVLATWIGANVTVAGNSNPIQAGPELPEDRTSWATPQPGFVMLTEVGGSPNSEILQRQPVFTCSCYSNNGDSDKPLWRDANALADAIRDAIESRRDGVRPPLLVMPQVGGVTVYFDALLINLQVHSEPRRVRTSSIGNARFDIDVEVWWAVRR